MPCLDSQEQAEYDTHQRNRPRRPAGFDNTTDEGVEDMPCTDYVVDAQYERERWAEITEENELMRKALLKVFTEHPSQLSEHSKSVQKWFKRAKREQEKAVVEQALAKQEYEAKKAARAKLLAALSPKELKVLGVELSD